ncbi:MAG: hypothetical protein K6F17_04605 [Lachnospiraceae bacterium]|nr:hypothetical protein [Lachnospiraceae bacterium]
MEQNKTIFNYIGQLLATYGIIVTIFIVFTCLIGEKAKNVSSLYSLGSQGLSLATLVQLLALAGIITLAQVVFLTDCWIKSMNMILRCIVFFVTISVGIGIFAATFTWFPVNNIMAWLAFAISFTICTVISVFISKLKENAENKKMEQALAKIKKQD